MLWVALANVSGGDWTKQSKGWQEAAIKWRDNYHKVVDEKARDEAKPNPILQGNYQREVFPCTVEPCGCVGAVMADGRKRMTAVCETHTQELRYAPEDLLLPAPEPC